jgi:hypothetical protein
MESNLENNKSTGGELSLGVQGYQIDTSCKVRVKFFKIESGDEGLEKVGDEINDFIRTLPNTSYPSVQLYSGRVVLTYQVI